MTKKEEIKLIYTELQGYLSQAPKDKDIGGSYKPEGGLWGQVNKAIDELNEVTGKDYNRYRMVPVQPKCQGFTLPYSVSPAIYRAKLGGLISRLHAEYFSDEPHPFGEMPTTVISQTQQQSQSIQVQMLLDFQSKIDEKIDQLKPEDNKRKFLEKIKGALASVKDYAGLIALYVTTAKAFGLTLEELSELFK